jgi:hypothetical protein
MTDEVALLISKSPISCLICLYPSLPQLAVVLKAPRLTSLDLTYYGLDDRPEDDLPLFVAALKSNKTLTQLCLTRPPQHLTDSLFANLPPTVTDLTISDTDFQFLSPLADALKAQTSLTHLKISSYPFAELPEDVATALCSCPFRELRLEGKVANVVKKLPSLPFTTLTALNINTLKSVDLDLLASVLTSASSLTSLTLSQSSYEFSETVYTKFFAVIPQSNLVHLDLEYIRVEPLFPCLSETKLESLRLKNCKIGASGLGKELAACLPRSKLTSLSIENEKFDSALFLALKHSQISSLKLNNVLADGAIFPSDTLASVLPDCPLLCSLSLDCCGLYNRDAKLLAPVLARSRLTSLDLGKNYKIGYDGAIALVKGLKSSAIRRLNCYGWNFGDSESLSSKICWVP